ncbi:AEC family transporter [Breoghania sp.]|uniref:AEC family transporter n=1 Tax=Breoghania sp. TaxID=2065378 RepID=UPI002AA604BA|nr:AEC family transporter [Breoghania sp.]
MTRPKMFSFDILTIVLPIFLLIAIGYAAALSGVLDASVGDALSKFVNTILIPVLLFRTLATASFDGASPWALWGAYFSAAGIVWAAATILSRKLLRREARYCVIAGIVSAFSNTALVGIPIISTSFSEVGLVPLFVIMSVHLPSMTIASTLLMERAAVADGTKAAAPLGKTLVIITRNLLTNPIVIGIICAVAWRLTGQPIPELPANVIKQLAGATIPVALFSLGMSLRRYGIRGNVAPAILVSILKVIVMPALVWTSTTYVFHLPPLWVQVATLTAACPTGVNGYLFAASFGTGHALSANTISLTTATSIVSIGFWMHFVGVM